MADTVLIPTHSRPATLKITLDNVAMARKFTHYNYVFAVDAYGGDEKTIQLIDDFINYSGVNATKIKNRKRLGLTKNILDGFVKAFSVSDNFVIIIEDDIRVSHDFFEYIEYCMDFVNNKTMAVSAYSRGEVGGGDKSVFRYSHYYSLGTAVLKDSFNKYIAGHCNNEYYYNRNRYLVKNFSNIMVDGGVAIHNQQAGLFQRVLKTNDMHLILPAVPRAQHFGFFGGNRRSDIEGLGFDDQIKIIKDNIDNPDELARLEKTPYKDYVSIKEDHHWTGLEMV